MAVKFHRLPLTVLRGCSAIVSFEHLRWKLRKLRHFGFLLWKKRKKNPCAVDEHFLNVNKSIDNLNVEQNV